MTTDQRLRNLAETALIGLNDVLEYGLKERTVDDDREFLESVRDKLVQILKIVLEE